MQGRERIVRDPRPRVRDLGDEGRFAGVRHAQQADVGKHLELKSQKPLLARFALRRLPGRAVDAALEVKVPQATLSTPRQDFALAVANQIEQAFVGLSIMDFGTNRHAQDDVIRSSAVLVTAAPMLSTARPMQARIAVIHQGIDVAVGNGDHTAAAPAITTVRTALGDVFFATKARHAIATVAGNDLDSSLVNEFHRIGR